MDYEQEKRYNKIFHEEFFLLNYSDHVFSISGSTKNTYTILLEDLKLSCNCPDMKSHARRHGVLCKHICFIYHKIGKLNDLEFYSRKKLIPSEYETLISNIKIPVFDENIKERTLEDCPICFEQLTEAIFCPDCGNPVHKRCMEKWLESHSTCIYCRSSCWSRYK
jgi:hypothetical protein